MKGIREEEQHQKLEIVNRNGFSYLAPTNERDSVQITGYPRWEQAFRIYSNIITSTYSNKALELLQYNHTIHTASQSYVWDNMYAYDHEFRHHISRHIHRPWNVILQQAWTRLLKDRLCNEHQFFQKGNGKNKRDREPCRRFNKGRCSNGLSCKFDHRCSIDRCRKFGHGAHICRLRNQSLGQNSANTGQAPVQEETPRDNASK